MTAFYAPDPINSTQLIPGGNTPAAGGLLFCYQVGSSTKQNTYTDATASTARTNPIVLDSGGNIPGNGEVWIASTAKFVLAPSNDTDPPVSPYWSRDNLPGVNDPSQVQSEWIPSGLSPTFVNGSTFTFNGDQTPTFTSGRRLKTLNTAGTFYSGITSSVFGVSVTTIGILSDSIGLDAGLSQVSYGLLNAINESIPATLNVSSVLASVLTASTKVVTPLVGTGSVTPLAFSNANGQWNIDGTMYPDVDLGQNLGIANKRIANVFTNTIDSGSSSGVNVKGTQLANEAASISIGEYFTASIASSAAIALTTATTATVTSLPLTAGDWDVTGVVDFMFASSASYTNLKYGISTSAAFVGQDMFGDYETPATIPTSARDMAWVCPTSRLNVSTAITAFLLAEAIFTASTTKTYGTIRARRVR